MESTARICFPFPVQTHTHSKAKLGRWENTARDMYLDMKSHEKNYGLGQEEN